MARTGSHSIVEGVVRLAVDALQCKVDFNRGVVVLLREKGDCDTADRVDAHTIRILNAIEVMNEDEGCWG